MRIYRIYSFITREHAPRGLRNKAPAEGGSVQGGKKARKTTTGRLERTRIIERERGRERTKTGGRTKPALLISKVYRGRRKSARAPGMLLRLIDRGSIIDLFPPRPTGSNGLLRTTSGGINYNNTAEALLPAERTSLGIM